MGRRRRQGRGGGRLQASAEAGAFLRDDMPDKAKLLVRLQQRGGRRRKARCLVCQTPGSAMHYQVWVPAALLHVDPGAARPQRYTLCTSCLARHTAGTVTDDEIGVLLAQRQGQR